MKANAILVLDDGDTWSFIGGSSICILSDKELQQLQSGEKRIGELTPLCEIVLRPA